MNMSDELDHELPKIGTRIDYLARAPDGEFLGMQGTVANLRKIGGVVEVLIHDLKMYACEKDGSKCGGPPKQEPEEAGMIHVLRVHSPTKMFHQYRKHSDGTVAHELPVLRVVHYTPQGKAPARGGGGGTVAAAYDDDGPAPRKRASGGKAKKKGGGAKKSGKKSSKSTKKTKKTKKSAAKSKKSTKKSAKKKTKKSKKKKY